MKNNAIIAVLFLGAVGIYLLYQKTNTGCSCKKNFSIAEIQEQEDENSTVVKVAELMPNFGRPEILIKAQPTI
jgi:hypothetical protein